MPLQQLWHMFQLLQYCFEIRMSRHNGYRVRASVPAQGDIFSLLEHATRASFEELFMNLWSSPVGADRLIGQQLAILAEVHRLIGPAHTHPTSLSLSDHPASAASRSLVKHFCPNKRRQSMRLSVDSSIVPAGCLSPYLSILTVHGH